MLAETAVKYYGKEYDLNCAETMMYAANEEYGLNLSKETLRTMGAFGGGFAVESTCGVICGAVAVLGIMFVKERGHESTFIKELTKEYVTRFEEALGTAECSSLKKLYRDDEIRCAYMIEKGAEILDDIVKRNR